MAISLEVVEEGGGGKGGEIIMKALFHWWRVFLEIHKLAFHIREGH